MDTPEVCFFLITLPTSPTPKTPGSDPAIAGAWAARYLAKLIELVGLPKDGGDQRFSHDLYKACGDGSIFDDANTATSKKLLAERESWPNVKISALCCFDTVGSLGLPRTGLAKPLALFANIRKKQKPGLVSDVASSRSHTPSASHFSASRKSAWLGTKPFFTSPDVQFSFHCLSLHETRRPFRATLMRGAGVHQVYFPGNHGDLGWIDDDNDVEGLVHAPFAWMIQQLHTHLGIRFDEAKLARRFPAYNNNNNNNNNSDSNAWISGSSNTISHHHHHHHHKQAVRSNPPAWCLGHIRRPSWAVLAIMGYTPGGPGRVDKKPPPRPPTITTAIAEEETNIQIHIGARLRDSLDLDLDDNNNHHSNNDHAAAAAAAAVPGCTLKAPPGETPYWARRPSRSRSWPQDTWAAVRRSWSFGRSRSRGSRKSGKGIPSPSPRPAVPAPAGWIEEAQVGPLEARLLGLSPAVVSRVGSETVACAVCDFCRDDGDAQGRD